MAKVMFLLVSVILLTWGRGVSTSVHVGIPPGPNPRVDPQEQPSPLEQTPWEQTPWGADPWDQTPLGPDPPGKQTPAYSQ